MQRLDRQSSPPGNSLCRIHQQVHEDLIQLIRETIDFGKDSIVFDELNSIFHLVMNQNKTAVQTLVNVYPLARGLIKSRKVLQAANDVDDAVASNAIVLVDFLEDPHELDDTRVFPDLCRTLLTIEKFAHLAHGTNENVVVAVDRTNRRVDFVRDARY